MSKLYGALVNSLAQAFKKKPVILTGVNKKIWAFLLSRFSGKEPQTVLLTFSQSPTAINAERARLLMDATAAKDREFQTAIINLQEDHLLRPIVRPTKPAGHPAKKSAKKAVKKAAPRGRGIGGPARRIIGLERPGSSFKSIYRNFETGSLGGGRSGNIGNGRPKRAAAKKAVAKKSPVKKAQPASPKAAKRINCYTRAEMDKEILLHKNTLLTVTISLEKLVAKKDVAMALAKAAIQSGKPLFVSVRSVLNIEVIGKTEKKIESPTPDNPVKADFKVKGLFAGKCTVAVDIRQEQVPLCTLKLNCVCVVNKGAINPKVSIQSTAKPADPFPAKVNQLMITEDQLGDKSRYVYRLELVHPVALRKKFTSPLLETERDSYISNLYKEIDGLWGTAGGKVKQFDTELRSFGAILFNKLFPAELQELLYKYADQMHSIQLVCDQTQVPWELLLIKKPGTQHPWKPMDKFLGEFGLIRWLEEWVPPDLLTVQKGRARYVIPDYKTDEFKLPGGPEEQEYLRNNFGAVAVEADPIHVNQLLRKAGSFDLLHFCCHGEADLKDAGNSKLMLGETMDHGQLAPTFLTQNSVETCGTMRKGKRQPIIVLNSCKAGTVGKDLIGYTGFACAFLNAEAGIFVSSLWSVEDVPAAIFVKTLYGGLLAGKYLYEATIAAREEARKNGDATWISYVVYGHPFAKLKYIDKV